MVEGDGIPMSYIHQNALKLDFELGYDASIFIVMSFEDWIMVLGCHVYISPPYPAGRRMEEGKGVEYL